MKQSEMHPVTYSVLDLHRART